MLNKTICPTTQQRYTIEDLQSQNIAVFERPNTIVSLCIDKNKKKNILIYRLDSSVFDKVMHFIQNPMAVSLYSLAIQMFTSWKKMDVKCQHRFKKKKRKWIDKYKICHELCNETAAVLTTTASKIVDLCFFQNNYPCMNEA